MLKKLLLLIGMTMSLMVGSTSAAGTPLTEVEVQAVEAVMNGITSQEDFLQKYGRHIQDNGQAYEINEIRCRDQLSAISPHFFNFPPIIHMPHGMEHITTLDELRTAYPDFFWQEDGWVSRVYHHKDTLRTCEHVQYDSQMCNRYDCKFDDVKAAHECLIAREENSRAYSAKTAKEFRAQFPNLWGDNYKFHDNPAPSDYLQRRYQTLRATEFEEHKVQATKALATLQKRYPQYFNGVEFLDTCPTEHTNTQGEKINGCPAGECPWRQNYSEVQTCFNALRAIKDGIASNRSIRTLDSLLDGTDEFLYGKPFMKQVQEAAQATAYAGLEFAWPLGESGKEWDSTAQKNIPWFTPESHSEEKTVSYADLDLYTNHTDYKLMTTHWAILGGFGVGGYALYKVMKKIYTTVNAENQKAKKSMTRSELAKEVVKRTVAEIKATKLVDQKLLVGGAGALAAGLVGTGILNTKFGRTKVMQIMNFIVDFLLPKQNESDYADYINWTKLIAHWTALGGLGSFFYALCPLFKQAGKDLTAENEATKTTMTRAQYCKAVTKRVIATIKATKPADQKLLIGGATALGALLLGTGVNKAWNSEMGQKLRNGHREYETQRDYYNPGFFAPHGALRVFFAGRDGFVQKNWNKLLGKE